MDEQLLREAFILGLRCSREGFNGECMCDHLAPCDPFDGGGGSYEDAQWGDIVRTVPDIERLWQLAQSRLASGSLIGWIPVGERMPEDITSVLVWRDDRSPTQSVAHVGGGIWRGEFYAVGHVTHWMPLPEPPGKSPEPTIDPGVAAHNALFRGILAHALQVTGREYQVDYSRMIGPEMDGSGDIVYQFRLLPELPGKTLLGFPIIEGASDAWTRGEIPAPEILPPGDPHASTP